MKFVAHRGYSAKYPDNTLPAFEAALKHPECGRGLIGIEIDIRLTRDSRMAVFRRQGSFETSRFQSVIDLKALTAAPRSVSKALPFRFRRSFALDTAWNAGRNEGRRLRQNSTRLLGLVPLSASGDVILNLQSRPHGDALKPSPDKACASGPFCKVRLVFGRASRQNGFQHQSGRTD
jgi:hypothetical protein